MNKELRRKKRYQAEKRFQVYGIIAISLAIFFVGILVTKIFSDGTSAFSRTMIKTEIKLDADLLGITDINNKDEVENADYYTLIYDEFTKSIPFSNDEEEKQIITLLSPDYEYEAKDFFLKNKDQLGKTVTILLTASDDFDQLHKGNFPRDIPEDRRRLSNFQLQIYDQLVKENKVTKVFNNYLFTKGDSRDPELAGFGGAIIGSFFTILICLIISFPIALMAAVYLEEFAPKNRITELIEININNLAAVPSIVYGLFALGILLNFLELPRSTALVGGIALSLMTLPRIIIPARASLKAVPPSIREGALAVGASKVQAVFHHVVPLAMPGTLSGTIIGLAQALGETAPLLLIGMVAFVVEIPGSPLDPSSSLPVQVYLWSESAERGFVEKTSATIMMLLGFLIVMNSLAVYARQKFEKKWN
jgi:phosphate transport system permease protein